MVMATPGSKRTQSAEEIHNLLRIAVAHRRPIAAVYKEFNRLLCPHRLGWNKEGGPRVLSYQYGGESSLVLPADPSPSRTGVAWRWRRSAKWSYWMACGTQQKTTHDRRIASNESKSTSTISQSVTDKTDSKRVAATEAWRSGCVAWQSSKGYVVRDGSGDPRGR